MSNGKTSKFKMYLIGGGALALVMFIGYLWFSSAGWTYSVGNRAGVVVKFSKKGTMFKTWEGELSQGAVDQGGVREKFHFSVQTDQMQMTRDGDDDLVPVEDGKRVVDLVQDALDSGHRVKLLYRQQRGVQSWKGQTNYFVVGVEQVGQ